MSNPSVTEKASQAKLCEFTLKAVNRPVTLQSIQFSFDMGSLPNGNALPMNNITLKSAHVVNETVLGTRVSPPADTNTFAINAGNQTITAIETKYFALYADLGENTTVPQAEQTLSMSIIANGVRGVTADGDPTTYAGPAAAVSLQTATITRAPAEIAEIKFNRAASNNLKDMHARGAQNVGLVAFDITAKNDPILMHGLDVRLVAGTSPERLADNSFVDVRNLVSSISLWDAHDLNSILYVVSPTAKLVETTTLNAVTSMGGVNYVAPLRGFTHRIEVGETHTFVVRVNLKQEATPAALAAWLDTNTDVAATDIGNTPISSTGGKLNYQESTPIVMHNIIDHGDISFETKIQPAAETLTAGPSKFVARFSISTRVESFQLKKIAVRVVGAPNEDFSGSAAIPSVASSVEQIEVVINGNSYAAVLGTDGLARVTVDENVSTAAGNLGITAKIKATGVSDGNIRFGLSTADDGTFEAIGSNSGASITRLPWFNQSTVPMVTIQNVTTVPQ